MLIAEEYLLQATDESGRDVAGNAAVTLAGAMLCDLAVRERLDIDNRGRLVVLDSASTGDPLLDLSLADFASCAGKKPKDVLGKVGRRLPEAVYTRLEARGLVRREDRRILAIFPQTRWPLADTGERGRTREQLLAVLEGRAEPDPRTGAIIALVHAAGATTKLLHVPGLSAREVKGRAKAVSAGQWASAAVAKAISDAQAAVAASVAISAGAASSS